MPRNLLRSPGIDSKESILPFCVAWRVVTLNRVVVPARQAGNRFLGYLKGLQILALLSYLIPVLGTRDILVRIRILLRVQLLSSVTFKGAKTKYFLYIFLQNLSAGTLSSVLKFHFFANILC